MEKEGDTRRKLCMYTYLKTNRIYESQLQLGLDRPIVAFELSKPQITVS